MKRSSVARKVAKNCRPSPAPDSACAVRAAMPSAPPGPAAPRRARQLVANRVGWSRCNSSTGAPSKATDTARHLDSAFRPKTPHTLPRSASRRATRGARRAGSAAATAYQVKPPRHPTMAASDGGSVRRPRSRIRQSNGSQRGSCPSSATRRGRSCSAAMERSVWPGDHSERLGRGCPRIGRHCRGSGCPADAAMGNSPPPSTGGERDLAVY